MNKSVWACVVLLLLIGLPGGALGAEPQALVQWSYTTGGSVTGVAVSSDGGFIAASSEDGFIYGFHKNGSLLWKTEVDSLPQAVAMSSRGDWIFTGDDTGLYLLNATGDIIWKKGVLNINDVAASPDGSLVVVGTSDGFVRAFDMDGAEFWSYKAEFGIQGVGVSRDAGHVAAGASDGMVYYLGPGGNLLWSFDTGRFVNDMGVAGDAAVAATERNRVFYLKDGGQERSDYYASDPLALGLSPDETYLAAGLTDGSVYSYAVGYRKLWDLDAGSIVYAVDISSGGEYLAAGVGNQVKMITPPDMTPPVITITSPRKGAIVSGSVTIDASFDEPVATVEVEIDGEFAGGTLPRQWTTSTYPEGRHTILVRATDKSGNTAEDFIEVFVSQVPVANASSPTKTAPPPAVVEENETGGANLTETLGLVEEPGGTSPPFVSEIPRKSRPLKTVGILLVIILGLALAYLSTTRRRERRYQWKGK